MLCAYSSQSSLWGLVGLLVHWYILNEVLGQGRGGEMSKGQEEKDLGESSSLLLAHF